MSTVLAVTLLIVWTSLVLVVVAGTRHGHEQYQRGYLAGQAAARARGER